MTTETGIIIPTLITPELIIPTQHELEVPPHVLPDNMDNRAPEFEEGELVANNRFQVVRPLQTAEEVFNPLRPPELTARPRFRTTKSVIERKREEAARAKQKDIELAKPEVYEVIDTETGERAALKVLYEPSKAATSRTDRELAAHVILNGVPGIVETLDMGTLEKADGQHRFVATKLNEEGTLAEAIRHEGMLTPEDVLHVGIGVVRAVQNLEAKGIAHGDIKPDNVLISPNKNIALMDFGTAAIPYAARQAVAREIGSNEIMTPLSELPGGGTKGFAAPELLEDPDSISSKSDTFGAAGTIYKAATGVNPFAISFTDQEHAQRVRNDTIQRPSTLNPNLSPTIDEPILASLESDPRNRPYPQELGQRLVEYQVELGIAA